VDFELDGKTQKLPMPALINLRSHPDESHTTPRVRRGEHRLGVGQGNTGGLPERGQGRSNTLNKRRGREGCGPFRSDSARIDRKTLKAMLGAIEDSFPMFRKYFNAKAKKLGKEKLAWWDIFAPLGKTDKVYSFEEARDFMLENFGKFSPDLRAFAQRAFDNQLDRRRTARWQTRRRVLHGDRRRKGKPRAVQLRRVVRPGEHDRARTGARLP
jgi:oligoendopeptidase F